MARARRISLTDLDAAEGTNGLGSLGGGGGGASVSDAAYGAGWNGDTTTAPSKNAVYDKIQSLSIPVVNSTSITLDFGNTSSGESDIATGTVSASWVTSSTKLVCTPFAVATADHDPEDYALEGIQAYATNINNGVGFDVIARAPQGSFGQYTIHVIGM
jgi:hypothetical protein